MSQWMGVFVAAVLVGVPLAAQDTTQDTVTLPPAMPMAVAPTIEVTTRLAVLWDSLVAGPGVETSPTIACLYGKVAPLADSVILLDSVKVAPFVPDPRDTTKRVQVCGTPAIGMVGFINGESYVEEQVLPRLALVLRARKEFLLIGEVHGAAPSPDGMGTWARRGLVWGATVPRPPVTKERHT